MIKKEQLSIKLRTYINLIKKQYSISKFNFKLFYKEIDRQLLKNYVKIVFILLGLSYLVILTRIVLYGIPFELVELKNIIISTQSYFIREIIFPMLFIVLFLYAVTKSIYKFLINEILSIEGIFLILFLCIGILGLFFNSKVSDLTFYILLFLAIIIFILDMLINFKKYRNYVKIFLLLIIIWISYNLVSESVNQIRYTTLKNYKHFEDNNLFSRIVYNYILEYKKPYIARVKIDKKDDEIVIILGTYNGYIYYYPKKVIFDLVNGKELKEIKKDKICYKKDEVYYPKRIIELLKTSVLRTRKFERKQIKRVEIETEYISFIDSFCKEKSK